MKTLGRWLSALLGAVAVVFALPAQSQQFSQVVVFGDSLSDAGYYRPVLGAAGVPPSLLSILGRFTTAPGPVWSELVAAYYGAPTGPSNVNNGTIFAQGGARVTLPSASTPTGAAQRPVTTQITEYLSRTGGSADPNALYAIWAGANDVLQTLGAVSAGAITSDQASVAIQTAAGAEIQQIARLRAAGARYIVVFNLPNIGQTPGLRAAGAAASAGATQLAAGFNLSLFAGLAQNNIRVIPVDSFTLLAEIQANPSRYGFTNVTTPACGPFPPFSSGPDALFCPPNVWAAPNANLTYLFADGIHPTTAAHAMIAQFVEQMISGPHQYSLLAEVPLHSRQGHLRALSDGLTLGRRTPGGERWNVFASFDHGVFEIDNEPGVQGLNNKGDSGTIGITTNLSEAVTLGVAVGQSKSRNSFANGLGNFNTNDKVLSLFGSVRVGGFWGTGVASISELTYGEIRRNVTLGPATRTANATTDGSNASGQIFGGYDFGWRGLTIGPVVGVTIQNVEINGFDESESGTAATTSIMLRMAGQTRKSEVWSVGGRASFDLGGGWTPWLSATYDKERRDDVRVVTATPMTLATGNSYDVPAYMPDTSYTTLAIGIRGQIDRLGIAAAYTTVLSRSGIRDDGATLLISYRF
jgi:outer membrane lipase/esterase